MSDHIKKTVKDIKSIKIQGATNVFKATVFALKAYALKNNFKNRADFLKKIESIGKSLAYARPTEPLAQNGLRFFLYSLKKSPEKDVSKLKKLLAEKADFLINQIDVNKEKIVGYGAKLIKRGDKVFTHCHSSTVEKIITQAHKTIKDFQVFNTETRPLFQGRITSKNLLAKKVDVTMVADSFAPFLISRHSGKDLMMDKIFLGGDLIAEDGSVVNKIGSFGIGISGYYEKVPLYVAIHLLKFNSQKDFKIEQRSGKEIWPNPPKGLKIINYAFDIVPAKFITGIITEFGVIRPKDIAMVAREKYPWIFDDEAASSKFLYHGTVVPGLENLEPRKRCIPMALGKKAVAAVYATNDPAYAAAHAFRWGSNEGFDLYYKNGRVRLDVPEKYKKRLQKRIYIYKISANSFKLLPKVEPRGRNFCSYEKVKTLGVQSFATVEKVIAHFGGEVKFKKQRRGQGK